MKIKEIFYKRFNPHERAPWYYGRGYTNMMTMDTIGAVIPFHLILRIYNWYMWSWFRVGSQKYDEIISHAKKQERDYQQRRWEKERDENHYLREENWKLKIKHSELADKVKELEQEVKGLEQEAGYIERRN